MTQLNWERRRYGGATGSAVAEADCDTPNDEVSVAVAIQRFEWVIPANTGFAEVQTIGEGEFVCINESRNLGQEIKVSRVTPEGEKFFIATVPARGGGHPIKDYNRGDIIRMEPSIPSRSAEGFVDLGIF